MERDRIYRRYQAERRKKKVAKQHWIQWSIVDYNTRFADHKQAYVVYLGGRPRWLSHHCWCDCEYVLKPTERFSDTLEGYEAYLNDQATDFLNVINIDSGAEFHNCEKTDNWLKEHIGRIASHHEYKNLIEKTCYQHFIRRDECSNFSFKEQLKELLIR